MASILILPKNTRFHKPFAVFYEAPHLSNHIICNKLFHFHYQLIYTPDRFAPEQTNPRHQLYYIELVITKQPPCVCVYMYMYVYLLSISTAHNQRVNVKHGMSLSYVRLNVL